MLGARACLLCATALAACAGDPAFVSSDTSADSAGATDATTIADSDAPTDAVTTPDADATTVDDSDAATTAPDAVDADDTADAPDAVDTVDAGPGCGTGCGPVAVCENDRCVCPGDQSCHVRIVAPFVNDMSVGLDTVSDHLMIAFGRFDPEGLSIARWNGTDFTIEPTIAAWAAFGQSIAADADGVPHIAHLDPDRAIVMARPKQGGGWEDLTTANGPCRTAGMELNPIEQALQVGCVDPFIGQFLLDTFDPVDVRFDVPDDADPLVVGKNFLRVGWAMGPDGTPWVAWIDPGETSDERVVYLAYRALGSWTKETIGTFAAASSLAIAVDSLDKPHVFFNYRDGGDVVLSHAYYTDAIHITAHEVDRKTTDGAFGQLLVAVPSTGSQLDLVYSSDRRLIHVSVDGLTIGTPTVLQLASGPTHLDMVGTRAGRLEAAFIADDESLHVWLPRGP
ncbi:MAG: hypothetical protein U1F43_31900 [Myxococcota bacterium]